MNLILILIFGFVLRLVNLNQSFWLDETVQAITSKSSFLGLFTELRGDFHPPLYHLLMWLWVHLFGNGEIAMRLPSVFFGTVTIYVVYLIAKKLLAKKSKFPLIAALFMATAPFHIYYSQEARTYATTAFLASLSIYWFIKMIGNNGKRQSSSLFYILTTVLLLYADYYGLFVLLAQIVAALIISSHRETRFCRRQVLIFLLFLPCLPLLWLQFKTGSQATTLLPQWGRLVNLSFLKALPLTFIKFSLGRITIFNKKIYAAVAAVLFLSYGFIFLNGFFKNKKFRFNNLSLIILFWLLGPVLLAWLISLFIPNYQPFRLLLVLPAFYLLLVYGISKFSVRKIQMILAIGIVVVNLVSVGVYYFNPYFHREDWRGAVHYIEEQGNEKSLALLPSETSHWPYDYYSQKKIPLLALARGFSLVKEKNLDNLFSTREKPEKIYYLYYLADLFDPQDLTPDWLEKQKFVKIREVSFNQIRIQEWEFYHE